jgi:predicted nucleic acid-binding protein
MRVVNASPLIHLARVSLLDLLREPRRGVEAVVPEVVFVEVMQGAAYDPTVRLVAEATHEWLTVLPTPHPHPDVNQSQIDAGEIAVLSVALSRPGSTVVLDDRLARSEASRLGFP